MSQTSILKKIGLVFALPAEQLALEHILAEAKLPTYKRDNLLFWFIGSVEVVSVISGMGRQRCAAATSRLIENGATSIICAGFAAGLEPLAKAGDVCIGSQVVSADDKAAEPVVCSPSLSAVVPPDGAFDFTIHRCNIATSDTIICEASTKDRIHVETGAGALDMESYAAGDICRARSIPFSAIRSISDTCSDDLPDEIRSLAAIEGTLGQALFALKKPRLWPTFVRLRGQSRIAARNLGDVLGMMLLRLI